MFFIICVSLIKVKVKYVFFIICVRLIKVNQMREKLTCLAFHLSSNPSLDKSMIHFKIMHVFRSIKRINEFFLVY